MARRLGDHGRLLLAFGVASLLAVALGAFVCAASGVPSAAGIRNLAAWAVGAAAAAAIFASARAAWSPVVLCAAPVALAAAFLSPAQQGVHRWVDVGPVHTNVAMMVLPAAIVAFAALAQGRRWPWLAILAGLAVLVAQPDASQATALAAAAALVAFVVIARPAIRAAVIGTLALLAALAWLRPDPLQPVPEVEQLISLAGAMSPAVATLALLLLLAVAAVPVLATRRAPPSLRLAGAALGLCLLVWAAAPFVGPFPVPLAGVGMSPIVGAWLGVGLLAGLLRADRAGREIPAAT